ncbi:MAG: hypothetical protein R3324_15515, partial [Halobacteriales archaeon]|nr:hypothetical protein [Halobacteriales archaeon]
MTGPPPACEETLVRGTAGRVCLLVPLVSTAIETGRRIVAPLLPLIVEDLHPPAVTAAAAADRRSARPPFGTTAQAGLPSAPSPVVYFRGAANAKVTRRV